MQFDFGTIDPAVRDGTWLADSLNQWRDALHTMHSGNAAPAYAQPGTLWRDVSAGSALTTYKVRDGGADRSVFSIDNTGKVFYTGTLPSTGGTITGDLAVTGLITAGTTITATGAITGATLNAGTGTGSPSVIVNGAAGGTRAVRFRTASSERWLVYVDSVAEGGSNAGSNFNINRYTDAGAVIDSVININRATGRMTLSQGLTISAGGIAVTATGVTLGAVTGGNKGTGTINLTSALYFDGVVALMKDMLALEHPSSTPILYMVANGINSAGGQIRFRNGAADRWYIYGSVAEAGSDSGSNLYFRRFTDAGSGANIMELRRSGGVFLTNGLIVGAPAGGTGGHINTAINSQGGFYENGVKLSVTGNPIAWVRFQANGTIASDLGVSTVVRNSAGNYTITFSPALASSSYVMFAQAIGAAARFSRVVSQSTTTLVVAFEDASGAANDPSGGAGVAVFY